MFLLFSMVNYSPPVGESANIYIYTTSFILVITHAFGKSPNTSLSHSWVTFYQQKLTKPL